MGILNTPAARAEARLAALADNPDGLPDGTLTIAATWRDARLGTVHRVTRTRARTDAPFGPLVHHTEKDTRP